MLDDSRFRRALADLFAPITVEPEVRECEVCGSQITPHALNRFCSNSCRLKVRRERLKAGL